MFKHLLKSAVFNRAKTTTTRLQVNFSINIIFHSPQIRNYSLKMPLPNTMRAAVLPAPGPPTAFQIKEIPMPVPSKGQVLIRVRAAGLNRSEMYTRQGYSPSVKFPRVLGIEAVGTVAACPGGEFSEGKTVATAMGNMGRDFDGGYAEYCVVSAANAAALETKLPWEVLGALPEMLGTVTGSLFRSLALKSGEKLLIRGGTTSIGLAAAAVAKHHGAHVTATTRNASRLGMVIANGADEALVDDGALAKRVPKTFDKVLELVGVVSMADSLKCTKRGGIVCLTGIAGNKWTIDDFNPMTVIPTGACLTVYGSEPDDALVQPGLQELVKLVEDGSLKIKVAKVFKLDEIAEAHELMENAGAGGKIVLMP
jgi:NADPH:quinone reductase-like Zn-dependent oxidoreductase